MQANTKLYTEIDYECFPIADLTLDRHWIQLPTAVLLEKTINSRNEPGDLVQNNHFELSPTSPQNRQPHRSYPSTISGCYQRLQFTALSQCQATLSKR